MGCNPASRSAIASAAPTGPPPIIAISAVSTTVMPHPCLDVGNAVRRIAGEDLTPGRPHQHSVLDADADTCEPLGHTVPRPDVAPRLYRKNHSGLQGSPLTFATIIPCIVHVEAEPVA